MSRLSSQDKNHLCLLNTGKGAGKKVEAAGLVRSLIHQVKKQSARRIPAIVDIVCLNERAGDFLEKVVFLIRTFRGPEKPYAVRAVLFFYLQNPRWLRTQAHRPRWLAQVRLHGE